MCARAGSRRGVAYCLCLFLSLALAEEQILQKAAPVLDEATGILQAVGKEASPDILATNAQFLEEGSSSKKEELGTEVSMSISSGTVLLMTTFMAGAAGLGTIPFFFTGKLSKEVSALANAVACGVMIACSFDLIHEGQPYGGNLVIVGVILGAIFISASQQWLDQFEDVRFQGLQGINARKILLMIGIMAAHAFGEGAGVGVSFCGSRGWAQGVLVTLAIGLHNIPEGLAVSTVLVGRGISPRLALLWTLFTAMPQPLVAVPSFLFVDAFRVLLPMALGFAAGCMVWMVFAELLPDALADAPHGKVATVGTFSAASLEGLRMLLSGLEGNGGKITLPVALNADNLTAAALQVLPAALSGILIANLGRFLPKEQSSLLGLGAGLLTWQGLATLMTSFGQSKSIGKLPAMAFCMLGAVGVVLVKFVTQLQSKGGIVKEKVGDTPRKAKAEVIVAADQTLANGHNEGEVLDDLEAGRGGKKRTFEPYKYQDKVQAELLAVMAASILMSVSEGSHTANIKSIDKLSFSHLWLASGIRAAIPSLLATAVLQRRLSQQLLLPAVLSSALVAPAVSSFSRIQTGISSEDAAGVANLLPACAAGATLMAGLWILWPMARRGSWKQGSWAVLEGLFFSLLASVMLRYLCWHFSSCL